MKKIISTCLCIILLFSLAACGQEIPGQTETAAPSATTDSTVAEKPEPSADFAAPLIAVSVPTVTESTAADDGTILFSYTYQNLFLTYTDQDVASQITLDFHNRLDYANSYAPTVLSAAKNDYATGTDWEPYSYSVNANPMRLDQSVLSFYGTKSFYDGAPQSTVTAFSANYDLLTGKSLELKDVLVPSFSAEDLSKLITDGLSKYANDGILFADYTYIISDMFATNTPVENWYFGTDGLSFFFAPMEIAPNSAGTLLSCVPYSQLGGILKDDYFPAEQTTLVGEPVLSKFTDETAGNYQSFTELILDKEAPEYILHTNGAMRNVRISKGEWQADGKFTEQCVLFAASTVCTADALMLQAEPLNTLRLTYESAGEKFSIDLATLISE